MVFDFCYFIFIGYLLRVLYYWASRKYDFHENLRKIIFNGVASALFTYMGTLIHFDDGIKDGFTAIALMLGYLIFGWGIENLIMKLLNIEVVEQFIDYIFSFIPKRKEVFSQSVTTETPNKIILEEKTVIEKKEEEK